MGFIDPVPPGQSAPLGTGAMVATLVPVFALKLLLIERTWAGRGWARVGLGAFAGLGLAAYAPGLVHALKAAPAIGLADLVLVLAEAAAVGLLFLPVSNRWYRAVRRARAAPGRPG